ncbi:PREDICTED: uncharacterized protein LOC106787647 [Polistes canadensis]|uniref:uncharacterized protein LOC106787647 n=1 Tax=Polistes canadensis TaxID=91411 RepID=UPI000718DCD8|nr:PREDICTED: uncharacterized protein LOC106787647 [Polistes canadensis]
MDIFENRFYKLNYRLLSAVGLWPYEKSRLLRMCIVNIPVFLFNITQFFKICTSKGNFDILKEVIPILIASLAASIKYYFFDFGIFDIKLLMDNMIKDWNMWKSKEEIKIMEKFAHLGKMYTLGYTVLLLSFVLLVYIYIIASLFLLVTFIPPLMDIIIPLNESRPMELPVYAEYFLNDEDYFYLFYFHISLSIMINITTLVATDTQLMVFCCHVSGVFAVIGFRLENFLKKDMRLHGLTDLQRKECYKHVSLSIKGHKRALEFVKRMESSFSYSLLLQCGLNVICMSMCLYQVSLDYNLHIFFFLLCFSSFS